MAAARCLLTSFARGVSPAGQQRRDAALLEAAGYGETHLHVATLAGEVLGLGAFHRPLAGTETLRVWRRRTGGRAVAAGDGFAVVTLGLPHRSSLVADDRLALAPEQVMNRCVRGILAWLRRCGVDAVYPGLDMVTFGRRALAHLSFTEHEDGPTLFQGVLALTDTFATTARLLDRLDPEGRAPLHLLPESACTCLARATQATAGDTGPDVEGMAAALGAAYAATFDAEVAELDPAVSEQMVAEPTAPAQGDAEEPEPDVAPTAVEHGLLGPVGAAARVVDGRIAAFSLTGDFIAPAWAIRMLCERLGGVPATAEAVTAVADSVLEGRRGYLLGLAPEKLRALLARAVAP